MSAEVPKKHCALPRRAAALRVRNCNENVADAWQPATQALNEVPRINAASAKCFDCSKNDCQIIDRDAASTNINIIRENKLRNTFVMLVFFTDV